MKIDDIADSNDSLYDKAKQAWKLWDETEKFFEGKTSEEQEPYRVRMEYTLKMCCIIYSNVSVDERNKIAVEFENETKTD